MILNFFIRTMQMLFLLAVQVLVLNHIHLWGMGTPFIIVLLLVYMRLGTGRVSTLFWGFTIGLLTDIFCNTPGMCSAAMTFVALLQPPLLRMMAPRDCIDDMLPSYGTMGTWNHIRYVLLLLLFFHLVYFALECFSYYHIEQAAISLGISYAASAFIALAAEALRRNKNKE